MARPRKPNGKLDSIAECEEAMRELRESVIKQERWVAMRDLGIAQITEQYLPGIAAEIALRADLELQLQNYYMAHLDELEVDGKKSVQLTHGVMGRRLGSPALKVLNKSWTWESILTRLREVYGARFIRKPEPEVDKVAIKKANLPADDLKACGLKIQQDEDFYAEPERAPTGETA
jgi:phage host-nuclease inhibitor protein Gam